MLIGVTRGDDEDRGQGDEDGRAADDERDAGRHDGAEDEEQRQRRQRQRDDLAPLQVLLGHRLDVAVERRTAGELDLEARRLAQSRSRRIGSAAGESSGRQVEEDDVVGGVPVGRDLARRE